MQVSIRIRDEELKKSLAGLKADVPWVTQNAINDTLKSAQEAQWATMRSKFTIRNEAFLKYSVKLKFATRASQTGMIYIADMPGKKTSDIWETFEGGGRRTPYGSKYITVPTDKARSGKNSVVSKSKRPRSLQDSFVLESNNNKFIAQRKGKKQKLQIMYILKDSVPIPDLLNFYSTVVPTIQRNIQPNITKLLLVSMRKRGFTP